MFPQAPNSTFFAMGVGIQMTYVDLENDLIIIVRCIEKDKIMEFIRLIFESLTS